MTGYTWDKGWHPRPLSPELYSEAQVAAAAGKISQGDHALWFRPGTTAAPTVDGDEDIDLDEVDWADESVDYAEATGAAGCITCGNTWQGSRVCHCSACHLTFTAVGSFDSHRVRGRCLTPDELYERGFEPKDNGQWRVPAPAGTFDGRSS